MKQDVTSSESWRFSPTFRHLYQACNPGAVFFLHVSSHHSSSQSSSSSSSSSSSLSSHCILLFVLLLLQPPSFAKAKAVGELKGYVQTEAVLLPVSPSSPSSSPPPCGAIGSEIDSDIDPALRSSVVAELKAKMLQHFRVKAPHMLTSQRSRVYNGTHPEGKEARRRLRAMVASARLNSHTQGTETSSPYEESLPAAAGAGVEKYVFHSIESEHSAPAQWTHLGGLHNGFIQTFAFKTQFRLPEKFYHDLIIKSAILRMHISRSKANLCRKLASLGLRLTANVYLVEGGGSGSVRDGVKMNSSEIPSRLRHEQTVPLKLDSERVVSVEIGADFLSTIIDSEEGILTIGISITPETVNVKQRTKAFPRLSQRAKPNHSLKYRRQKLRKAPSVLLPPSPSPVASATNASTLVPGESISSGSTKLQQSSLSAASLSSSSSSSSSSSPSSSSPSSLSFLPQKATSTDVSNSRPPLDAPNSSSSSSFTPETNPSLRTAARVSGASLEISVVETDLRDILQALHAHSHTRSRRSAFRKRACRMGLCCINSTYVTFRELGFDSIIYPKGYDFNFCSGGCWNRFSNIISKLNRVHPSKVPDPSCVPASYEPIEIMRDTLDKSYLPDMLVTSCMCSKRAI